jgi:hypothetical protein
MDGIKAATGCNICWRELASLSSCALGYTFSLHRHGGSLATSQAVAVNVSLCFVALLFFKWDFVNAYIGLDSSLLLTCWH